MKQILLFLTIILAIAVVGCKKKKVSSQAEEDDKKIKNYIAGNGLNANESGSGLYYVITSQGTGPQPGPTSTVTVKYTGYLLDGTVFDQSTSGASFALTNVIKGWQEGMQYYKKGGKGKLLIPSALGYGGQATGKIPANSVLVFDVELIDVK